MVAAAGAAAVGAAGEAATRKTSHQRWILQKQPECQSATRCSCFRSLRRDTARCCLEERSIKINVGRIFTPHHMDCQAGSKARSMSCAKHTTT